MWTKSEVHSTWVINRAVRLPTKRYDCTGFLSILINDADFSQITANMSNLASLATLPPAIFPARSDPCAS